MGRWCGLVLRRRAIRTIGLLRAPALHRGFGIIVALGLRKGRAFTFGSNSYEKLKGFNTGLKDVPSQDKRSFVPSL